MAATQTNSAAAGTASVANPPVPSAPPQFPSDDEILGIQTDVRAAKRASSTTRATEKPPGESGAAKPEQPAPPDASTTDVPEELQAAFDANPALRDAWQAEKDYRTIFPRVEDARAAQSQVAELSQLDNWFFSGQPEAHAQLAATVYRMNPAAFRSLAQAMQQTMARLDGGRATEPQRHGENEAGNQRSWEAGTQSANDEPGVSSGREIPNRDPLGPQNDGAKQDAGRFAAFYQETNAAVVEGVVDAIRGQLERLLPEGISTGARNRVVGEIYRELDASLRSDRALAQQVRHAFRTGGMDTEHQAAVAGLILGRAKQALPTAAKKVINEWTTGVLATTNEKMARIRAAESRRDISGGGAPGFGIKRPLAPGDVDYTKLSDGDILNL